MSQRKAKKIDYPSKVLKSFYETSVVYQTRLESLLEFYYQGKLPYSKQEKQLILDTFLAARTISITVEDSGLLQHIEESDVVKMDVVVATALSSLLYGLSDYMKKMKEANIDIDLVH